MPIRSNLSFLVNGHGLSSPTSARHLPSFTAIIRPFASAKYGSGATKSLRDTTIYRCSSKRACSSTLSIPIRTDSLLYRPREFGNVILSSLYIQNIQYSIAVTVRHHSYYRAQSISSNQLNKIISTEDSNLRDVNIRYQRDYIIQVWTRWDDLCH